MEITEKQIEKICDHYCRFSRDEDFSPEQRAAICDICPLSEVVKKVLSSPPRRNQ